MPNTAPIATDDGPITTVSNTNATGNVLTGTGGANADTDADGDTLTVTQFVIPGVTGPLAGGAFAAGSTATIPGVGTLVINADGSFVFDPNPAYDGLVPSATYTITDGTTTAAAILSFAAVPNTAPIATDDGTLAMPLLVAEEGTLTLNLLTNDTDADGDVLTIQSINGVRLTPGTAQNIPVPNGTVNVSVAGVITFTPNLNYNGPIFFDYVVQDPTGATDTGTVNIGVTPVNDPPVATPATAAGTSEKGIPIRLTGTDVDGTIAGITLQTLPSASQGTLTLADGTPVVAGTLLTPAQAAGLIFKPNAAFKGIASFSFTVTDNEGAESLPASANVTVVLADSGLFEQLVAPVPTVVQNQIVNPSFSSFAGGLDGTSLHVSGAVYETANTASAGGGLGLFNPDTPTGAEIRGLNYDLKGIPIGMVHDLFVQNAVRHLPIATEPNLFVQNAVRQSQVESLMRNVGVTSVNSATNAVTSMLDPFATGAPNNKIDDLAIDGVNGKFGIKADLSLDANKQQQREARDTTLDNLFKEIDAKASKQELRHVEKLPVATQRHLAAASFAKQIKKAASKNII